MAKPKASDELLTYARHLVAEWRRADRTDAALSEAIGRSPGFVSQFRSGKVGMGLETLRRLASAHGMTLAEFETAAVAHARGEVVESRVELPERYPNRAVAAAFARASGVSDEAVRAVEALDLQSDEDLTPDEWLTEMRAEARRTLFARPSGERLVDPDETRPNIPKLRK